MATTFSIGDRVKFAGNPALGRGKDLVNGQVVYYRGKHSPKNPRVRWGNGWGITVRADAIALLTAEELSTLPPVKLSPCDFQHDSQPIKGTGLTFRDLALAERVAFAQGGGYKLSDAENAALSRLNE